MVAGWAHSVPSILAAFFASLVEFIEALTVVLAVGSVRGWRSAIGGSGAALILLLAIIAVLGAALTRVPLHLIQIAVGALLLLFGLRWLRKAILRGAGAIPLHDEDAVFATESARLRSLAMGGRWDVLGFASSFQITMLEGMEVVFIVVAVGASGAELLLPGELRRTRGPAGGDRPRHFYPSPTRQHPRKYPEIRGWRAAFRVWHILDGGRAWRAMARWRSGDPDSVRGLPGDRPVDNAGMSNTPDPGGGGVMRGLAPVGREIFALFVDDGRFALSILAWLAAVALLLPLMPLPPAWHGPALFAGLALVLAWTCLRHVARRARRPD
jgi:hypothetical protein